MKPRNPKDTVIVMLALLLACESVFLSWIGATSSYLSAAAGSEQEDATPLAAGPESEDAIVSEAIAGSEFRDVEAEPVRVPYDPPADEPRRDPTCAIEVVGPDSRPCRYCPILAIRDGKVLWLGSTNDEGFEYDAPPDAEPVDLVIDACTTLHRATGIVFAENGRVRVELPAVGTVSGRVTFDDGPPLPFDSLWVELIRDAPLPGSRDLPAPMRKRLDRDRPVDARAPVLADGSFAFLAVDPGFEGHLVVRPRERLSSSDPARPGERLLSVPVSGRADGLVVHLRANPVISAKVTRAGADYDTSRVRVKLVATLPDSTVVTRWSGCDFGSRFEIPLDFRTPDTISIEIEPLSGRPIHEIELDGPFDADRDLGTIEVHDGATIRRAISDPEREDRPDESGAIDERLARMGGDRKQVERTVRGKVVDDEGAPIEDVEVSAIGERWSMTSADGAFELGPWLPERFDLQLRARAHLPLVSRGIAIDDVDGHTFVMQRGRKIRLTVVDHRGEPFVRPPHIGHCDHGWEAWITQGAEGRFNPDDGLAWSAARGIGGRPQSPAGPGVYDFLGLPEGVVTIHVEGVEGPVHTLDHDTRIPEARLVVPAHGSIRLSLDALLDDRWISVHLEPAHPGGTAMTFVDSFTLYYDGTLLLPAVLPGAYTLRFERPVDAERRKWRPLGSPAAVVVRAGETTVLPIRVK